MFASMCDGKEDRPTYQRATEDGSHSKTDVFEKIENAGSLWERRRIGNNKAEWPHKIKTSNSWKVTAPCRSKVDARNHSEDYSQE